MPFVNTVDLIGDEALSSAFIDRSITEISDDKLTSIGFNGFNLCTELTTVDFPVLTSIGQNGFANCSKLNTLILRNTSTVCSLGPYGLNKTSIASGTGYIYVPRSLVDTYKAATNWSTYANQFRALEDYTVDGTTTGELDPTKI